MEEATRNPARLQLLIPHCTASSAHHERTAATRRSKGTLRKAADGIGRPSDPSNTCARSGSVFASSVASRMEPGGGPWNRVR